MYSKLHHKQYSYFLIFVFWRHLGSQLAELERVIERMMEADFIEFATTNLAKPLEDYDEQDHVIDEVLYIRRSLL